jgi:hypothetical protein
VGAVGRRGIGVWKIKSNDWKATFLSIYPSLTLGSKHL